MRVIDAQVHVWPPQTETHPWRHPEGAAIHRSIPIVGRSLVDEMESIGVDQVVLCPPYFVGYDNRFAIGEAEQWPDRFRVMARVDLSNQSGWTKEPATNSSLVSGIRLLFLPQDAGLLAEHLDSWIWRWCTYSDTPVMLAAPGQIEDVGRLARRYPHLRFALDHFGLRPGVSDVDVLSDIDELLRLSSVPNLSVKASSLPCFSSEEFPYASMRTVARRVIEAFGSDRVFWGSDLSRLRGSYRECLEMFSQFLDISLGERQEILGMALARWLRWDASVEEQG